MKAIATLAIISLAAAVGPAMAQGSAGKNGEQVYNETCVICHRSGWAHAPRMGDQVKWKKLIAEGIEDLGGVAIVGARLMPPKGGREEYSDLEVLRGVVYMANRHGANWPEPTAKDAAEARADREKRAKKGDKP